MFHSAIIATKGRAPVLRETLHNVSDQDSPPDEIIISASEDADVTTS